MATIQPVHPGVTAEARKRFGLFLSEIRKERRITQAQIAEALGVDQARVSQIESGKAQFFDLYFGYAAALGLRWLLKEKDDK